MITTVHQTETNYNNKRTATVTITEHNFDTSRIALSMTAQDAGKYSSSTGIWKLVR